MSLRFFRNSSLAFLCIALAVVTSIAAGIKANATGTSTGEYKISAGGYSVCAIESPGTVKCWGKNNKGQLGRGTTSVFEGPGNVNGINNAVEVSVGYEFACAILATKEVKCWGANGNGQLGIGSTSDQSEPVLVTGINNAKALALGWFHACALLDGGSVKCWGENGDGYLGDGTTTSSSIPVTVVTSEVFKSIRAGSWATCAINMSDRPFCWGYNGSQTGELGIGVTNPMVTQVKVPTVDVDVIAALDHSIGSESACVLKASHEVICRGSQYFGQLGTGVVLQSPSKEAQYVQTSAGVHLTGAVELSSFDGHCALIENGTVKCWGGNDEGQAGVDPSSYAYQDAFATEVSGLTGVVAITSGFHTTCAVLQDLSVKCWGRNREGQLANGSTDFDFRPQAIQGVTVMRTSGATPTVSPTPSASPTRPVAASASVKPTVTGTSKVGRTLTAHKGTWAGSPAPTFKYQWYSCSKSIKSTSSVIDRSCTKISGKTATTIKLERAQKGKYIALLVTGQSRGTAAKAWMSKSTGKVS